MCPNVVRRIPEQKTGKTEDEVVSEPVSGSGGEKEKDSVVYLGKSSFKMKVGVRMTPPAGSGLAPKVTPTPPPLLLPAKTPTTPPPPSLSGAYTTRPPTPTAPPP